MKIFFDTEFTGLHKDTTLISIGLIDKYGRTFYGEFSDYDESKCDNWIRENVIKHLKWSKEGPVEDFVNIYDNAWEAFGSKEYIKIVLTEWLSKYNNVELVSDCCHYDMVLFIDIFGDAWSIPDVVNPACHDINQDIAKYFDISEREAFDLSREKIIEKVNIDNQDTANHFNISKSQKIINIEGDKHNALYDAKVIKEIYEIVN